MPNRIVIIADVRALVVVNLASRLQDLTKEYDASILLSGQTYSRVKHLGGFRDLGAVQVRGRQQPVDLYEMRGTKGDQIAERSLGTGLLSHR